MRQKELSIVRKLIDMMNDEISYVHWKSNQHFYDALSGIDDLDILIDRTQYNELMIILGSLGFKHFYIPEIRGYVGVEDYLGFDEETGSIIHLHLHSQLVIGEDFLKGFLVPIEHRLLSRRIWNEEYKVFFPNPSDELLLLILRMGMKNRKRDYIKSKNIDQKTKAEFEWLKENCQDFNGFLQAEKWLTNEIRVLVYDIYKNGFQTTKLTKLKLLLYRQYGFYTQGGAVYNTIKRHIREFKRILLEVNKRYLKKNYSLLRRRSCSGGVLVAFLGSDGAGKSTNIKSIKKWLFQVMDVRYFYLGSGDGNSSLLRLPLKVAAKTAEKLGIIKKSNNFNNDNLEEINTKKTKLSIAKKLWVYTLSKERIKKLTKANRCRLRGFVVLTDRYPQSEYNGLCDGPRLAGEKGLAAWRENKAFRIAKLCSPDLVIKLIVSPEEAMKRKPGEINYATSLNLTERIKSLNFSDKTKIVQIDADQKPEKVLLDIKKAIWAVI